MTDLSVDIKDLPGPKGAALVKLSGTIDARTVLSFKSQLESAKARGCRTFVLDMERVTYINSTGLSYLISLADAWVADVPGLSLVNVQAKVKVLIDMMGLGTIFRFCGSVEEAMRGLKGTPAVAQAAADSPAPPAAADRPQAHPAAPAPSGGTASPLSRVSAAPPPAAGTSKAKPREEPAKPKAAPAPPCAPTPVPVAARPPERAAVSTARSIAEPPQSGGVLNEDWISVALGIAFVAAALSGPWLPAPHFTWATDGDFFAASARNKARIDRLCDEAAAKGDADVAAAAGDLRRAYESGDRSAAAAASERLRVASEGSRFGDIKAEARRLISGAGSLAEAALGRVFGRRNLLDSVLQCVLCLAAAGIGVTLMGGRPVSFIFGFPFIFLLGWLARTIAGNVTWGGLGLEPHIAALLVGLLVGSSVGIPGRLRESLRGEFYLKTGLVILGSEILLSDALRAGVPGLVQGALVAVVVGYAGFWGAKLFRVDEDFSSIMSTGISIGGLPASVGALVAVRGDRRKLSYLSFLMAAAALPAALLLSRLAREMGLSNIVAGAWLGGTLDTYQSLASAGAVLGEDFAATASDVKRAQEVFVLAAALILASVWSWRHAARIRGRADAGLAWKLFPKAVLGFFAVSIAFSLLAGGPEAQAARTQLKPLRDLWFVLGFVSIGLEARFGDIVRLDRGLPAAAFLSVLALNAGWALLMAYLLFGGVLLAPVSPR